MTQCIFEIAWIGQCKEPALPNDKVCDKHKNERWPYKTSNYALRYRCYCGEQAVRECPSAGSLVCGAPLCEKHKCKAHGY